MRDYRAEAEEVLAAQGGCYTFDDILQQIHTGHMQSFAEGDTWVVTQVHNFPRKKVLDIAFVIGDIESLQLIEPRILAFAQEVGADMLTATGRLGWTKKHLPGWKATSINFVRA